GVAATCSTGCGACGGACCEHADSSRIDTAMVWRIGGSVLACREWIEKGVFDATGSGREPWRPRLPLASVRSSYTPARPATDLRQGSRRHPHSIRIVHEKEAHRPRRILWLGQFRR